MRTLYFNLNMGAAGDMLTAALLSLYDEPKQALSRLNAIGVPKAKYVLTDAQSCGISGSHIRVEIDGEIEGEHEHTHEHEHSHVHTHEHSHGSMHEIEHTTAHLNVPEAVKTDILTVYRLLAEAESAVHGVSVSEIHFHEVGQLDAIADIAAVCLLINGLMPARICASAVHVGCGSVKSQHGILPVPAPATAKLLTGVPIYGGKINGELCTPTGAALLKYFVTEFGEMPEMSVAKIAYGMGTKVFPAANCVVAMLGDSMPGSDSGDIAELCCNLDDMTPEALGFACEALFSAGALDVFTTPIVMKKSRAGVLLTVLVPVSERARFAELIIRHTSTLGVREAICRRYTLNRRIERVKTPLGEVRVKLSEGYGATRSKYEYDDIAALARARGMSIAEVLKEIEG